MMNNVLSHRKLYRQVLAMSGPMRPAQVRCARITIQVRRVPVSNSGSMEMSLDVLLYHATRNFRDLITEQHR